MQYVTVKTFDSYITANLWLGRLLEEGIDCFLKDEFSVTINPILSNAIGGIKLCVNDSQLEAANKLVIIYEEENKQIQKCPNCNSLKVQYIVQTSNPSNVLLAIVSFFLGHYALSSKQVYHCYDCGFEFDEINVSNMENE